MSTSLSLRPEPTNSVFNTIGPPMSTGATGQLSENPSQAGALVIGGGAAGRGLLIPKADPSLDGIQDRILQTARLQVRSATAGPDGRFAFQRVYPGTYKLEVTSIGITLPAREIQVGTAGLTNVSVQVPAIQVTGRVIARNGGPLPQMNYIRLVRSGSDTNIFYGFPDREGRFSILLLPGQYRVFTESLGPSVQSVSDGSRDITNTEFTFEGRDQQIVVTLAP